MGVKATIFSIVLLIAGVTPDQTHSLKGLLSYEISHDYSLLCYSS